MSDDMCWQDLKKYYEVIGNGAFVLNSLLEGMQSGKVSKDFVNCELVNLLDKYKRAERFLEFARNDDEMYAIIGEHYRELGSIYMALGRWMEAVQSYNLALDFIRREDMGGMRADVSIEELRKNQTDTINDIMQNIGFCEANCNLVDSKHLDADVKQSGDNACSASKVACFLAFVAVVVFLLMLLIFV